MHVMHVLRAALAFAASLAVAFAAGSAARGDQYSVLTRFEADRAVAALAPGDLVAMHCSCCSDEPVEVYQVIAVEARPWEAWDGYDGEPMWDLHVTARRLYQTVERFGVGQYAPARATFTRAEGEMADARDLVKVLRPDLAYLYVERGRNRFVCVSLLLGLPTSDPIPEIALPHATDDALEALRRPRRTASF